MRIHLTGIGGIAMGNLAIMLQQQGHKVSGSDAQNIYPPMSDKLRENKIRTHSFSKSNVLSNIDLYIVGNAISRGNPELETLLNKNYPYLSMPQALREFFLKDKQVIMIAGTHGKTTTSFLLDHILNSAGMRNGFFAGGIRKDGQDGFRVGNGKYFVIEGDEYDTAFFDKNAKFFHYHPYHLILTALEYDHADIYPNIESYMLSFTRLLRFIPEQGLLVACQSNPLLRKLLKGYKTSQLQYYKPTKYQYGRHDFSFIKHSTNFALNGQHNQANALAASLMATHIGVPLKKIQIALETFEGVKRRMQIRWQSPTLTQKTIQKKAKYPQQLITFIEDFAHHPGAVAASINAVRHAYKQRYLHVLFEPRSASSHRKLFQEQFLYSFEKADSVWLCELFNRQKVPPKDRLNVREMQKKLQQKIKKKALNASNMPLQQASYAPNPQVLLERFQKNLLEKRSKQNDKRKNGDVILALSNGSFGGIYNKLESFLDKI